MSSTQNKTYDAIVIGSGHNGMVCAAYLAKAGKSVLVLEARQQLGGQLVTEQFAEGFKANSLQAGGQLSSAIVRDLNLSELPLSPGSDAYVSLLPDGRRLWLRARGDCSETLNSIRQLSEKDAQNWPAFVAYMNKAAAFLEAAYGTTMPRLPKVDLWQEGVPLALLLWKLRRTGGKDMFRIIRSLSMSTLEFLEEWFESDELRAAIAGVGVHGVTLGAMSAGTGFTLLHQWLLRGGLAQPTLNGGSQQLADQLGQRLTQLGAELRTNARVEKVLVERSRAVGVLLSTGERINTYTVLSAADPRHSLLSLVGAVELPPEFVWQTQSIKMRGSVAKIHFHTNGQHGLPSGTVVLAPSIRYLERAYDAAKYGQLASDPYLEITALGNTVSVHWQSAPYALKQGDWASVKTSLPERVVALLSGHFPAFKAAIIASHVITPRDMESEYGLTEGDLNHGQLILDQLAFMRPLPGWSNHKTPIDGFYLCGSGVHGGGGISGYSGRNAAKIVLQG